MALTIILSFIELNWREDFSLIHLLKNIYWVYRVWPEDIQPCNMKNRDIYWRRYNVQETLYKGQWHLSPLQSRHFGTSHSSPSCHQLSHYSFVNLSTVWNLFPFKGILIFGKVRRHRSPNPGCRGAESPGSFDILLKNSARDVMHEWVHCCDEAANHQRLWPSESSK